MSLQDRTECISLIKESIEAGATQEASCGILELSVRTLQRWQANPDSGDLRRGPKTPSAKNLREEEKLAMLALANSEDYRNLSPHKIVVKLYDV